MKTPPHGVHKLTDEPVVQFLGMGWEPLDASLDDHTPVHGLPVFDEMTAKLEEVRREAEGVDLGAEVAVGARMLEFEDEWGYPRYYSLKEFPGKVDV